MNHIKYLHNIYSKMLVLKKSKYSDLSDNVEHIYNAEMEDLKFIRKAQLANSKKVFEAIVIKYASDYNYESGFYFKKNYDLGEGWTAFLDAYRDGKVGSIKEWVEKHRRGKKGKKTKTASHWRNQVFIDGDLEYKVGDISNLILDRMSNPSDIPISVLEKDNLNTVPANKPNDADFPGSPKFLQKVENVSLTFPIIVIRYPDKMIVADGIHRLWKARALGFKTIVGYILDSQDLSLIRPITSDEQEVTTEVSEVPLATKAASLSVKPIDSYCASPKNIEYWEEMLDGEDDEAVKDFIKYIKEVKC